VRLKDRGYLAIERRGKAPDSVLNARVRGVIGAVPGVVGVAGVFGGGSSSQRWSTVSSESGDCLS